MQLPSSIARLPGRPSSLAVWLATLLIVPFLSACAAFQSSTPALNGTLKIWGSTALDPLVSAAATLFTQEHPAVMIDRHAIGSRNGLKAVANPQGLTTTDNIKDNGTSIVGIADIGTSDIYADPVQYPNPDLTDHIVCVVPFVMIINPAVTITSLTQQQIIDIFSTGKIANWKDVGGPDLPIKPIVRPASSGTRATFRKYVLGGRDEKVPPTNTDVSQAIHDAVATTPGAISYISKAYVDDQVKAIAIGGFDASATNIRSGNYTFWSYEHMYTLDDTKPLIAAFLAFMTSPQVQQIAQTKQYLPIDSVLPSGATGTGALAGNSDGVEVRPR